MTPIMFYKAYFFKDYNIQIDKLKNPDLVNPITF